MKDETKTPTAPEAAAATEAKQSSKPKAKTAPKKEAKDAPSVLVGVGKDTIKRHGYDCVFVTSDGTAFPLECDARNHAANLQDKEIIKVTKE